MSIPHGYRKFSFAIFVILSSEVLVMLGKLTGDQFVALATATTIAFLGANAAQSIGGKLADNKKLEVKLMDKHDTPR